MDGEAWRATVHMVTKSRIRHTHTVDKAAESLRGLTSILAFYLFQYSGLKNSMDCIVQGVTKNRTQLSDSRFDPSLQ